MGSASSMDFNWEGYLKKLTEKKQLHYDSAHAYDPLYRAILRRDWDTVREFIHNHPDALTAQLTDAAETVTHKAAESFEAISVVKEIVEMMSPGMLEQTDEYGNTALSRAALVGNAKVVRLMMQKHLTLSNIENKDGLTPLDHAARFGHVETVHCLLSETLRSRDTRLSGSEKGSRLLLYLINSDLFGFALDLLKHYPEILHQRNSFRKNAFVQLARKPLAFQSGSHLGYWESFIYHCIPLSQTEIPFLFCLKTSQHPILHNDDVENPEGGSAKYMGRSSCYKVLHPAAVMLGAFCRTFHVIIWRTLINLGC